MKKTTQRTLEECKRRDWPAWVVERSVPTGGNQFIRTTIDCFNFGDVLVMDRQSGSLMVQACGGGGDAAAHVAKMEMNPHLRLWLSLGNRCEIWAWRKVKLKRGGKAVRWRMRCLVGKVAPVGVAFPEKAIEEVQN